jgi:hypothetical protein
MAETGWVNVADEGTYEVQKNIFSEAIRHRVHKPDNMFHDWFDGEPPYRYLKEGKPDA